MEQIDDIATRLALELSEANALGLSHEAVDSIIEEALASLRAAAEIMRPGDAEFAARAKERFSAHIVEATAPLRKNGAKPPKAPN